MNPPLSPQEQVGPGPGSHGARGRIFFTALGGAGLGVLVWLVGWSAAVLLDYALFANIEFLRARLDLSGGEYGPVFSFVIIWMCGMVAGLPAFGVIWALGAVRGWRQGRMLIGAVLASIGALLATALTGSFMLQEKWAAPMP